MGPLTVIVGILLGSSAAIAVCLAAVLLVFLILGDQHPLVAHEFGQLGRSVLIFLSMTAVCAASFYTLLIHHRLRFVALGLMFIGFAATTVYYLP